MRSRSMLLLGAMIFAVCVWTLGSSYAVKPGSATEAMKGTIDEVLGVLKQEALKSPDKKDVRLKRLMESIGKRFDYEEMGKRTLSKEKWNSLGQEQKQEFVSLFQRFLTRSYASNVDSYSGEQVEYIKERQKGAFAEVQTNVVSPKTEVPIDYRLVKKNNEWRVYDVVIDRVSLMKNYRGQFGRIIKSSSFEGLLEKLRAKNGQVPQP